MFGFIAGRIASNIVGKLMIALTVSVVATATVGLIIDSIGKGKAYERELDIRVEIAEDDDLVLEAQSAAIDVYKRDIRTARASIDDFRRKQMVLTTEIPKLPEDKTGIPKCVEICKY